ncbi:uroporphyrinogen-III synthase [uncultured Roseobacter sp.]|uniref:uroporphyrinogen-III synthase n=1 Tax=uncultured Roseobacter sp. TaxID=114847 RepID=UPI002607A7B6|nr:uroporphyrinogen-III synthase [uncultured Roseobacter sp.]
MQQPLIPMIVTRPAAAGEAFVRRLPEPLRQKLEIIESPLLSIVPVTPGAGSDRCEGAVFTSSNGVRYAPDARGRKAWCVGGATTETARQAGWDAVEAGADSAALTETLISLRPALRLAHFSGVHTRGRVADRLSDAGFTIERIAVYDQPLLPLTQAARAAVSGERQVIVPLFSPRTAAWFTKECPAPQNVIAVFLSAAVARATGQAPFAQQVISAWPDAQSVVTCIENLTVNARPG